MLFASGELVDLVGGDIFAEGKSDRVVEAGQQLSERLVFRRTSIAIEACSSAAVATQPTG